MTSIAFPASLPLRRRIPWVLVSMIATAALGVAVIAYALTHRSVAARAAGEYYTVVPTDMDVTVSKDGELQAVNNLEITSPLEGQNTILDIAKEGTFVHKGEVIIKFDSADIERKIETATLDLQKAEADLTAARESKEIQESTNNANLEAANVELILARLDLQQYVEGTYPSDLKAAKTGVEMGKISVKNKEDTLAQTRSLFSKGFVTAANVKEDELALITAKNELDKKTTDLQVLEKYTHEKELTDRRNKVAQAEKKLARVQRENASQLAQKQADLQAKEQTLSLRQEQFKHLQEQLASCTIKAPGDGMIVYSSSSGSSWGRRETPIQPGAQVRQQEQLIRLPDTTAMKAVCRINEAQVTRLRVDSSNPIRATVKIVGQSEPLTGWLSNISIMADNSSRWWNPDSKEYPVDVTLDHTPAGLKPGLSVEVMMYIDRLRKVLGVPVSAVYAAGSDSYVFVRNGDNPQPLKVTIGQVNDTHAQVTSGLVAGQEVLILQAGQGRELLEKAGIKIQPQTATTQPFSDKPPTMPPQAQPGGARPPAPSNGEARPSRSGGRGNRERSSGGGGAAAGAGASTAPSH